MPLHPDLTDLGSRYDELYTAAAAGNMPPAAALELAQQLVTIDPAGNRWRITTQSNPGSWQFETAAGPAGDWTAADPASYGTAVAAPASSPFTLPGAPPDSPIAIPAAGQPTIAPRQQPDPATVPADLGLPPANTAQAFPTAPAPRQDGIAGQPNLLTRTVDTVRSRAAGSGRTVIVAVALAVLVMVLMVFRTDGTDGQIAPAPTSPATAAPTGQPTGNPTEPASQPTDSATGAPTSQPMPTATTAAPAPISQADADQLLAALTSGQPTQVLSSVADTTGTDETISLLRTAAYAGFAPTGITAIASPPQAQPDGTATGTLTLTGPAGQPLATAAVTYITAANRWSYQTWPEFTPTI